MMTGQWGRFISSHLSRRDNEGRDETSPLSHPVFHERRQKMSVSRNIDRICAVGLVIMILVTVLFMNGERLGMQAVVDADSENYAGTEYFTANDLDGTWTDNAYTTYIELKGDSADIDGRGAYFLDGSVILASAGWYVISGELTDGSIVVNTDSSAKVWIRFEGVSITCKDDACLIVDEADKVFLTLAEGSRNTLENGTEFSDEAQEDGTGGVIFAHDDLTINGSGELTITANAGHGIDANDELVITGGSITITSPEDGIHVNDGFSFTGASLTVEAGDDAIHSDTGVYIESGTILIPSSYEGIEALTIWMAGGDVTIYSSDDGMNANGGNSMGQMPGGFMPGNGGMDFTEGEQPEGGMDFAKGERPEDGTDFAKGERPEGGMDFAEGERPEDGMDFAKGERPEGGMDFAEGEKPEAESPDAAGQEDVSAEETWIRISGGTLTIINETGRDADGLDSNGNIYLDGGTILISLPGSGGNNAVDYGSESGGECIVTGGTLIACGGSSMVEEFSDASTQCVVLYNLSTTDAENTLFRVLDLDGNEILSYQAPSEFSSVAFSSSDLAVGETYTVEAAGGTEEITLESTAEVYGTGGMTAAGPGNPGESSDRL